MPGTDASNVKPPPVTPLERLNRIVEEGACSGCGLCEAIAGRDRIQVRKVVQTGYERPVAVGEIDQELIDRVYDVCPAARWDGLPDHLVGDNTEIDPVWGPFHSMVLAHAADPGVRLRAATGGVLTALGMFLVDTGRVDFVLHAKPSPVEPTYGTSQQSFDAAAVESGTGSMYAPTAPLRAAEELLSTNRAFAFVGKPCDIAALRNLARFDKRVDRLVKYWLTPVCGGWTSPEALNAFLSKRDVTWRDLDYFRHRGEGCPGEVEFATRDGREFRAHMYEPFGGLDEKDWKLPFRCKVCPDGPGESADIAAGDQWEDAKPDPVASLTDPGTNVAIVRTAAGQELFDAAVAAGYVTVTGPISPRWFDTCQPHLVAKKFAMRARFDGLGSMGHLVPRSRNLRLDALSRQAGPERYSHQYEGSRYRVRIGRGAEPAPVACDD